MIIHRIILFINLVITTFTLFKIDSFILPTVDYFGKYIFFGALNIFLYYFVYATWKFMKDTKPFLGDVISFILAIVSLLVVLQVF